MAVETSVYSEQGAITASQLRRHAARKGLELRFLDADSGLPPESAEVCEASMSGQNYIVIGWPAEDYNTTVAVDESHHRRDRATIDALVTAGKLSWFEIYTHDFDYEASWEGIDPDEREGVEAETPAEAMERLRNARTQYYFHCGIRPPQNGKLLWRVAEILRDAIDGFLNVP